MNSHILQSTRTFVLLASLSLLAATPVWASNSGPGGGTSGRGGHDDPANHDANEQPRQEDKNVSDRQEDRQQDQAGCCSASTPSTPKPKKTTKLRARIRPASVDFAGVHGKADRIVKVKKNRTNDRFTAKVEIPMPTAALNIIDETSAGGAEIHVLLSRSGTDYANCSLVLDEIDTELEDGGTTVQAEYKVDVELRNTTLRTRSGSCDTDLATDGIQAGVPAVQFGDTINATAVVNGAPVAFASGSF